MQDTFLNQNEKSNVCMHLHNDCLAIACLFTYCQYVRLDGIHSVIGAEKSLVGLHAKSQLYKILDVEKTRCTIAAAVIR